MSHWLLENLADVRAAALSTAERIQLHQELTGTSVEVDFDIIQTVAEALLLSTLDLVSSRLEDDAEKLAELRSCARDGFRLFRVLPLPDESLKRSSHLLRMCSLGVLGDVGADAARLLRNTTWRAPVPGAPWGEHTWATILDIWLRLIRKMGWEDRDLVLQRVAELRTAQNDFETRYLRALSGAQAKTAALELIGLYHLAKAAEIFALFITDGVVERNYQILNLLDTHFDRVFEACFKAQLIELEPLARLLRATSAQMIENSIWTVTRAVNSRVTDFVRTLVDRGRGQKAIFDVLPPQRKTLAEKGLLGSSRRAVVVSLPTSSGKTLIAEFRILQALNQFDIEKGWVAYLAPTRTLVNQVTRQLRRDFSALGIVVEQVSPALEIDGAEMSLLQDSPSAPVFRVLVTTPEKLDLLLRQGWELKINRPLTLVVVDEAHNIHDDNRGLKLELLLATINKECERAQFLLLTPFIQNAREVARWLGGTNSDDVSMSLDWQPNDRAIGISRVRQGVSLGGRSHDFDITFETVHTSRQTLETDEPLFLRKPDDAGTYSQASGTKNIAALTAQSLQERGPVLVMHARPDWVWSLADRIKEGNQAFSVSPPVALFQDYLRLELGDNFPLIDLLNHGIAVHHSGLSDDVRIIVERLFEENELKFLVATTTVAQGVNFPVTGVVMASHQYPHPTQHWVDMPPEDFWNIAGRAGRIGHGQLGVVALVAENEASADELRTFINRQTADLNSALIKLALAARDQLDDLSGVFSRNPQWSSFLQYLAHTYRQMGEPSTFNDQVEQVLRGTLGFEKLRAQDPALARKLLDGVRSYGTYLQRPRQPLKLVDSTGFSLDSVNRVLASKGTLNESSWDSRTLFSSGSSTLEEMMGVLLAVPELRENLTEVAGGAMPGGNRLALIIKDWVNGESVADIAERYFRKPNEDQVTALTRCGRNLFGKLAQTASWGLGALLAMTASDLQEEEFKKLSNLPSRVFYGVNSDEAITLRLLGVPRSAAMKLSAMIGEDMALPLPQVRSRLVGLTEENWQTAMGPSGSVYRHIWRVLEGLE